MEQQHRRIHSAVDDVSPLSPATPTTKPQLDVLQSELCESTLIGLRRAGTAAIPGCWSRLGLSLDLNNLTRRYGAMPSEPDVQSLKISFGYLQQTRHRWGYFVDFENKNHKTMAFSQRPSTIFSGCNVLNTA
ncbi:predicted protein [Histoplasma capsulatum var. duboisii H88]|uniref:Predicted protein n=2 Tax=Ajellomyces capsulatus TaxID=5037 RepID=F0UDV0_AJEC8|nr:predicted protein [Histoplasma capsulatum H143]EGC44523.1 predicted protein [Histoplasma capsulatum var. duboisii H88]